MEHAPVRKTTVKWPTSCSIVGLESVFKHSDLQCYVHFCECGCVAVKMYVM